MDGSDEPCDPPVSVPDLTAAIARGDEAAFTVFHRLYWKRLYAWLMVLTKGNESLAADLAQTTMVRAASRLRRMDSQEALWGWLRRVARNAFIDACRSVGRGPQLVEWREDSSAAAEKFRDESDGATVFAALEEALQALTTDDRNLIEQTYFNGRKQADLAGELGLSLKALESRLTRLRHKLRRIVLTSLRDE